MVTTGREHNTHSTFSTTSVHTPAPCHGRRRCWDQTTSETSHPLLFRRQRIRQPGIFRQPQPLSPQGIQPAGNDDLRPAAPGQGEDRLQGVHQRLAPQGKARPDGAEQHLSGAHLHRRSPLRLRQWITAEVTFGAGRKQVLETVNSSSGWV